MKPWIDPRERRAKWYFSILTVLSIGSLIAMIFLLIWGNLTSEEIVIALVTAILAVIGSILAIRQLRQLPREFQQYEEPNETSGGPA
jgi:ATP/ADP translocase